MTLVLHDFIKETATTTGTGSHTLLGAVAGYQDFSIVGNGNTTYYSATDGVNWETGLGTWATGGVLARTTVFESSNGGAKVNWSGATLVISCAGPSSKIALGAPTPKPVVKLTAASGTFTTDAKHAFAIITLVGGGGGGGACYSGGLASLLGAVTCGAQGGYALKKLLTLAATTGYVYTVGTGGGYTDVSANNLGGNTTFVVGVTTYSAPGGAGIGATSFPAVSTLGDENYKGSIGDAMWTGSATTAMIFPGGMNGLGRDGKSVGAGIANTGQGGSQKNTSSTSYNGGSGYILVEEWVYP